MPIYRNSDTGVIVDLPETIGEHPVLGASLCLYDPDSGEFEEEKTVVEAPVSTQRIQRVATPKKEEK